MPDNLPMETHGYIVVSGRRFKRTSHKSTSGSRCQIGRRRVDDPLGPINLRGHVEGSRSLRHIMLGVKRNRLLLHNVGKRVRLLEMNRSVGVVGLADLVGLARLVGLGLGLWRTLDC